MTSLVIQSKTGPDGKLHLEVPVGQPDTKCEAEVVVRPKTAGQLLPLSYFDLIGSVDDESFVVHPQPPMPPPLAL
jgi:hypothetical protein